MSEDVITLWKNTIAEQLNFNEKDRITFDIYEKPKVVDKLDDSNTPVCIVLPDILVACPKLAPPAIPWNITDS